MKFSFVIIMIAAAVASYFLKEHIRDSDSYDDDVFISLNLESIRHDSDRDSDSSGED